LLTGNTSQNLTKKVPTKTHHTNLDVSQFKFVCCLPFLKPLTELSTYLHNIPQMHVNINH